jgi:tetratricopeptide (TPR) repeat protein
VRGVEHLREGGYESARAALNEATRLHPSYVQAYSRLAEALSELDNDRGAQQALLQVSSLVPNQASLTPEDSLRVEAVRASVLHQHEQAVAHYRSLAALSPTDAGRWLDVGRAEEALGRRTAARESYERAVALDPQYASAHLRLGADQAQGRETMQAHASLRDAERMYRAASNREGEGEAMLRSAIVYNAVGERTKARESAERVVQIANDTGYQSLRLRADFQLARISLSLGQFTEAESRASKAAAEAIGAGLQQIAADGLTDLGFLLMGARRYEDADAQFRRAIELASEQKAVRTEMRARLQQA